MSDIHEIEGLKVKLAEEGTEILHGIDLSVGAGEVHVLMGPNGAGKSTLGSSIMGDPRYQITDGKVIFDGADITHESTDKIAKAGIFMSFQNPIEVPGISVANFIRTALENKTGEHIKAWDFMKDLKKTMKVLDMDPSYAERDLNVGFSGGEQKKAEIIQLLMLKPKLAILDETDSGLDVDAVRTVSAGIEEYKRTVGGALLIITHATRILESLKVEKPRILAHGRVIGECDASMVDDINENGFEKYLKEGNAE